MFRGRSEVWSTKIGHTSPAAENAIRHTFAQMPVTRRGIMVFI